MSSAPNREQRRAIFESLLRDGIGRYAAVARAYSHDDAEDLLQEILLQLWRSLPNFNAKSSPQTWAYRVAINTSLQWQRSAARRRSHVRGAAGHFAGDSSTSDESPDRITSPIETAVAVATAADPSVVLTNFLTVLGDRDKAVLLMYLDDLPANEIASVLGVSDGAVRVRLHRLEKRLAKFAEDHQ